MSTATIAPEAPPTTATLTLTAEDAVYLARVGASAASKDRITPVICGALLSAGDGVVTICATDRYRVHRARLNVDGAALREVILPRPVLDWIISNAHFFGHRSPLKPIVVLGFDFTDPTNPAGTVTVTVREHESDAADVLSYRTSLTAGNYPPVNNLIDPALNAPDVTDDGYVNLSYLSKARALASDSYEKPRIRSVKTNPQAVSGQMLVIYERGVALLQKATGGR